MQLSPVTKRQEHRQHQAAAGEAMRRALRCAPPQADGQSHLSAPEIKRLAPFLNRGLAFQSAVWQVGGRQAEGGAAVQGGMAAAPAATALW